MTNDGELEGEAEAFQIAKNEGGGGVNDNDIVYGMGSRSSHELNTSRGGRHDHLIGGGGGDVVSV